MKKYLLITTLTLTIFGCQKSNYNFKHHFLAKEGHDISTYDHATFCDSSDYLGTDTVELDNTTVYDSTKFGEHPGSIVFHSRVETAGGMWERRYCLLLQQIN